MVTSAGVILLHDNRILLCHVPQTTRYDLPKGKVEENETPLEACLRETFEETGIKLEKKYLRDLGKYDYLPKKNLHLFSYKSKKPFNVEELSCSTTHIINDEYVPEVDKYNYIHLKELYKYVPYNLYSCIKNSLSRI